ncbi:hypothetical protein IEQ34_022644 [Dendrobium chrysotoxum]|uniref:Uncharacterized protein n=1 Tax=Dendrobium chrysotoxum TaxID=161865 RepID=A0AAV7FK83_DENCH|nr:hypothetical protein IEQ34_022644 [Dendrobium chrysotoxum]
MSLNFFLEVITGFSGVPLTKMKMTVLILIFYILLQRIQPLHILLIVDGRKTDVQSKSVDKQKSGINRWIGGNLMVLGSRRLSAFRTSSMRFSLWVLYFKESNNFLWPFRLKAPLRGLKNKRSHYVEGRDTCNRENYINELIRRMS